MARASVSATPPGGKLTINLTGLSGQVCAAALAHNAHAAINATALCRTEVIDMRASSCLGFGMVLINVRRLESSDVHFHERWRGCLQRLDQHVAQMPRAV